MLYGLQCFVTVKCLAWLTEGDAITILGTSEEEKIKGTEEQVKSTDLNSHMTYVANSTESLYKYFQNSRRMYWVPAMWKILR